MFLLLSVFIYSITELNIIISILITSGILTLLATFLFVFLVKRKDFNPDFTYSFIFLSFIYGLIPIGAGIIIGTIMDFNFEAITRNLEDLLAFFRITVKFSFSPVIVKTLFYSSFSIPFIPIFIAFITTTNVFHKKRKSRSKLEKTLKVFESDQLRKKLQQIENELKSTH